MERAVWNRHFCQWLPRLHADYAEVGRQQDVSELLLRLLQHIRARYPRFDDPFQFQVAAHSPSPSSTGFIDLSFVIIFNQFYSEFLSSSCFTHKTILTVFFIGFHLILCFFFLDLIYSRFSLFKFFQS